MAVSSAVKYQSDITDKLGDTGERVGEHVRLASDNLGSSNSSSVPDQYNSINTLSMSKIPSAYVTREIPENVIIKKSSQLVPMQEWEGVVKSVDHDEEIFTAELFDLSGDGPTETAEIFLQEVNSDDMELVKPGAIFRWVIGYRDKISGQRERISTIVFRRLPAWTATQLKEAQSQAKVLADAIQWD